MGPWEEAREIAAGLTLLDSTESLSAVYHAVKWTLPQDAALIVTPVPHTPKLRGMAPGDDCLAEGTHEQGHRSARRRWY